MYYGSGCINCPVKPCNTVYYRGSTCAAQRAKFGLGDPLTNADRIRAMSDEELAEFLCSVYDDEDEFGKFINGYVIPCYSEDSIKEWLQMTVEDE